MQCKCETCGKMVKTTDGRYDQHGEPPCAGSGKPVAGKMDGKQVRRFERFDISADDLAPARLTAEGFLRLDGRLARTGVQEYRDAMGGIRYEMRPAEEVKASVPGFALMPLTNHHPPTMVSPDNAQKYVIGAVGAAKFDGKWIQAPLTVYTKDGIESVRNGRVQLSVGYQCTLVEEKGTYDGQEYTSKQTEIVVNHVALVDAARAGPDARVRLDGSDCEAVIANVTPNGVTLDARSTPVLAFNQTPMTQEKAPMAHALKIDNMTFEVADANLQAAFDKAIETVRSEGARATADIKAKLDAETKAVADAKAQLSALQAKHDGLIEQQKANEEKHKAEIEKVKRDGVERADLLVIARRFLGENEKLDGVDNLEIRRRVILKLSPGAKLDGKDESYILARFDGCIEAAPSHLDAARAAATARPATHRDDSVKPANPEAARQAMIERYQASFVKSAK